MHRWGEIGLEDAANTPLLKYTDTIDTTDTRSEAAIDSQEIPLSEHQQSARVVAFFLFTMCNKCH